MTVETYVDRARTRIADEQTAVAEKRSAFGAFLDRVADVPTTSDPSGAVATAGTAAGRLSRTEADERGCRRVRQAFETTVRPHSTADVGDGEPLLESVRAELSASVALALAPTTDTPFSPGLKRAVVSEATARRDELAATGRALEREASHLDRAGEPIETVVTWLARADETPLTALGFDALRCRHETLAGHRERLRAVADRRQAFLQGATNQGVEVGIEHRRLVEYLYQGFPVEYPVLSTAVRLQSTCSACQRAVRTHLVRRA
jgi:hypothetical protein